MSAAPNSKLLPCPFCGDEPEICRTQVFWVKCTNCECETAGSVSIRGAIAIWNRRALLPESKDNA